MKNSGYHGERILENIQRLYLESTREKLITILFDIPSLEICFAHGNWFCSRSMVYIRYCYIKTVILFCALQIRFLINSNLSYNTQNIGKRLTVCRKKGGGITLLPQFATPIVTSAHNNEVLAGFLAGTYTL